MAKQILLWALAVSQAACVIAGADGVCIIERPDQVADIVAAEGCTDIQVVSDDLENLDDFETLAHSADVTIVSATALTDVAGLPQLDGTFTVQGVEDLTDVEVTTSWGVTIEFGAESVERVRWTCLDVPESPALEGESPSERGVAFFEDIDEVTLESAGPCSVVLALLHQDGSVQIRVDPTLRIALDVLDWDVTDLSTLQQIPVAQLDSVTFAEMDPSTFQVLRAYREWLEAEGYEGPLKLPEGV